MTFFADSFNNPPCCSFFDIGDNKEARTHNLMRIAFLYFLSPRIHKQSAVVRLMDESIFSISKVSILFLLSSISEYAVWNFSNNCSYDDDKYSWRC